MALSALAATAAAQQSGPTCTPRAGELLKQAWEAQPMNVRRNNANPALAERLYREGIADSPYCTPMYAGLTLLLLRDNKLAEAYEVNEKQLAVFPDDLNALSAKGRLLTRWKQDYDGALAIQLRILERSGAGNGGIHYQIAATLSRANRLDESLRHLTLAVDLNRAWGGTGNAQVDPDFANLRADGRFWDLVRP
jgi:tetratricopeptide (TPR) repeat protein